MRHKGFTIVELLIVIVVIGILAGIGMATYAGVQERARDAQLAAALDTIKKVTNVYKAQNGDWPWWDVAPQVGVYYACLGTPSDYPDDGEFQAGECYYEEGGGTRYRHAVVSDDVNEKLQTISGSKLAIPIISTVLHEGSSSAGMRGVIYGVDTSGSDTAMIMYTYRKNNSAMCPSGSFSGTFRPGDSIAYCQVYL